MNWDDIAGYFEFKGVYDLVLDQRLSFTNQVWVEVGSLVGRSTAYMAQQIRDRGYGEVEFYAVDTWTGSGGRDQRSDSVNTKLVYGQEHESFDMFVEFLSNMVACGVQHYVKPLRMTSVQAASLFEDNSVDFCFLDGAHDYDSVREDLHAWWPKIGINCILAGDDYGVDWPDVDKAVKGFFSGGEYDFNRIKPRSWFVRKGVFHG